MLSREIESIATGHIMDFQADVMPKLEISVSTKLRQQEILENLTPWGKKAEMVPASLISSKVPLCRTPRSIRPLIAISLESKTRS